MAKLDMELNVLVKTIEARPGDIVALESSQPITNEQHDSVRATLAAARAAGRVPKDVCILWLEEGLSLRRLPEGERRALLDTLCASLGMRAVPL